MARLNFDHLANVDAQQHAAMRAELSGEGSYRPHPTEPQQNTRERAGSAARYAAAADRMVLAMRKSRGG